MTPGDILGEWEFHVTAGKIREFARAVRDVHSEDGMVAPPTFPMVASAEFVEYMVTTIYDVDRTRTVHGEQAFDYVRPIVAGDILLCKAHLASDEIKQGKRGGTMRVITTVIEHRCAVNGEIVCRETMTSIEKAVAA